jgi:hypothetical protein
MKKMQSQFVIALFVFLSVSLGESSKLQTVSSLKWGNLTPISIGCEPDCDGDPPKEIIVP